MNKIESIELLTEILKPFDGIKYGTNAYFFEDELIRIIKDEQLSFEIFTENVVLYKHREQSDFYEVYYYLIDYSSQIIISDSASFVMEIPYRGASNFPSSIVELWNRSGFKTHINRALLSLNKPQLGNSIEYKSTLQHYLIEDFSQSEFICDAIRSTFDLFTGDILSISEVENSIKNQEILGAYESGKLVGFLRFYDKNRISWIGHLVVLPEYIGKGIGKSLVANYLKIRTEQGFTNFQQWVISDNEAALKLYANFGFKFTNKNSISLLKK